MMIRYIQIIYLLHIVCYYYCQSLQFDYHEHSYSSIYNILSENYNDSSQNILNRVINLYRKISNENKDNELEFLPAESDKILSSSLSTTINPLIVNVKQLFPHCLITFHDETLRNFLYCNDEQMRKIPDFKSIYEHFNRYIKPNKPNLNLIFSKCDFSGSGIRRIRKNDLKHLKLDLFNNQNKKVMNENFDLKYFNFSFENYLERLKKTAIPTFHLDFDSIYDIEDGAFEQFIQSTSKLSYELAYKLTNMSLEPKPLLKIRFTNSRFDFAPHRKPFRGLVAQELHINNINSEYIANSIFDDSIINELHFEYAPNFIGFVDLSTNLPTGKLINRLTVLRSYKIDSLCSHSLPSFVNQETFHEIVIKKCINLTSIKSFTFYKYPHLKTLILSSNNLNRIDRNSFRYLSQLEFLDLSSNPINLLDDETFKDLTSLKRLYLESTYIKQIKQYTLVGLFSLNELRLTKSYRLSKIEPKAFQDCQASLRELHLKDTSIRLIDSIQEDDEEPPYLFKSDTIQNIDNVDYLIDDLHNLNNKNTKILRQQKVWIEGLKLNLLNIDSSVNTEQFAFNDKLINTTESLRTMCKILKHIPSTTLINLQRNQSCNCLIYLIYSSKQFPMYLNWEYKAPFCYRNQIHYNEFDSRKSFEKIIKKELDCQLDKLSNYCYPRPTTTTTIATKTTSTKTSTTTKTTTSELTTTTIDKVTISMIIDNFPDYKTTIRTRTRYHPTKLLPSKDAATPSVIIADNTVKISSKKPIPPIDFKKLSKVIATIIGISALSILLTIAGLRLTKSMEKKKKDVKTQSLRQRTNSNSSSLQTGSLNATSVNPLTSSTNNVRRKTIIMPPTVIPSSLNMTNSKYLAQQELIKKKQITKNFNNNTILNNSQNQEHSQTTSEANVFALNNKSTSNTPKTSNNFNSNETSLLLNQDNSNTMNNFFTANTTSSNNKNINIV